MKHKRALFGGLFASALAVSCITPAILNLSKRERIGEDNAEYGDRLSVDYNTPDVVFPKKAGTTSVKAASVSLHYSNSDGKCAKREVWMWCSGAAGAAHEPVVTNGGKDMEVSFNFTGEWEGFYGKNSIFFIIKWKKGTEEGGGDGWQGQSLNIEVEYKDDFAPDENGHVEIWSIPGEGSDIEVYPNKEGTTTDRFTGATFTDWSHIKISATAAPASYKLYALTSNYMNHSQTADLDDYLVAEGGQQSSSTFTIDLHYKAKVNVQYLISGIFPNFPQYTKKKYVALDPLYETERFTTYYNYDGDDLGCTYNGASSTTFKVWAPAAANVRVYLYKSGSDSDYIEDDPTATDTPSGGYNMAFRPGGVWELTITNKDLKGMYYRYFVANSLGQQETMDPYAKACGVNGKRAMIVDWSETNPDGWDSVPAVWDGVEGYDIKSPNELSVYESHIRDLTMDSTWVSTQNNMRGTYSAFAEPKTTYSKNGTSVFTGYSHIEEFGIKAVQLIPVFDNDNMEGLRKVKNEKGEMVPEREYNWGYNPLNYNCVDGSYATDPYNGISRIKEYKALIKAYSENANHTRIVMDVVYNHVSSIAQHCFTKLMPKYYFRYSADGIPENGSGCGNEVKTEAPMCSKYVVDSLCWWAKEYKVKGFRFDLMGLIDWKTMRKAAKALYKIDKDIYIYGEGWASYGGHHIKEEGNWGSDSWTVYSKLGKESDSCYIGCFNDSARNAVAGETGNAGEWGFVGQGTDYVGRKSIFLADMLVGRHTYYDNDAGEVKPQGGVEANLDPNMMVAYASCHDDFSVFDHIYYCFRNAGKTVEDVLAAATSANSIMLMTNGVAFIQGGQEVFLSKQLSAADYEKWGDERTVKVDGKYLSSNSYHLSDECNSIKWDRKISVGGYNSKIFYDQLKKACNERNKMPKYDKAYIHSHWPYGSDTGPDFNVTMQGEGSNKIRLYNDGYMFITAGNTGENCSQGFVDYDTTGKNVKFVTNPKTGEHGTSGYNPAVGGLNMWWYTSILFKSQEVRI